MPNKEQCMYVMDKLTRHEDKAKTTDSMVV